MVNLAESTPPNSSSSDSSEAAGSSDAPDASSASSASERNSAFASIPRKRCYGSGIYRRRIRLIADPERARGEIEDDFHHFSATLEHDGTSILAAEGEAIRFPWTTCPGSVAPLRKLKGMNLSLSLSKLAQESDPKSQCTHMLDVALLAAAHAKRYRGPGVSVRRYEIEVPDRRDGRTRAELLRDGKFLMEWVVDGTRIIDANPEGLIDQNLIGRDFARYVEEKLSPDIAEASLVMRRALMISMGRQWDFERIPRADIFGAVVGAACHTFQPAQLVNSLHVRGTTRDFTARPDELLTTNARR